MAFTKASKSSEASKCSICLEEVACRGLLTACSHLFCFECILEWSKVENCCPLCKSKFRVIKKVCACEVICRKRRIRSRSTLLPEIRHLFDEFASAINASGSGTTTILSLLMTLLVVVVKGMRTKQRMR